MATEHPQATGENLPTLTPRACNLFASEYAHRPSPTAINAPRS